MKERQRIVFLFPGQGAQYVGMGHDFFREFVVARRTFEEADDTLNQKLSEAIFSGDSKTLSETHISQPAIFVTSCAIMRTLQSLLGTIRPYATLGLSLGEYTALVAAEKISFAEALKLVSARGKAMHEAAQKNQGMMAVILGLHSDEVQKTIECLKDVVCANFNCPNQVVISGTKKGIKEAVDLLLQKGARKVVPLEVEGAFHSPLMESAKEALTPLIEKAPISMSSIKFCANVTANFVDEPQKIKELLIQQIVSPTRWEESIRLADKEGIDFYIELGPGTTLSTFNRRIGTGGKTFNIEKVQEIKPLEQVLE